LPPAGRWRAVLQFAGATLLALAGCLATTARAKWGDVPDSSEIFHYDRVSIVFAAQNLRSPVSQFGHSFLVFHREDDPEPSALTVEFAGRLEGFDSYLLTLVGGARGHFLFSYFSYKARDYELEDRSLWIYELALTPDEKVRLKRDLVENLGREFPYGIARGNCASYIIEAVAAAHSRAHDGESPLFVTPDATVRWLRHAGLIASARFRPSRQSMALQAYETLPGDAQMRVRLTLAGYGGDESPASAAEQDAASRAADYLLPREDDADRRSMLLALKRAYGKLNADPPASPDPSLMPGAATASITVDAAGKGTVISIRPGFIGPENADNQGFHNARSEFGRVDLRIADGVSVDRVVLVHTESYTVGGYLRDPFTQELGIFYANYEPNLGSAQRETALDFGRGLTLAVAGQELSLMPMVSLKWVSRHQANSPEFRPAARAHLYGALPAGLHYMASIDRFYNPRLGISQLTSVQLLRPLTRQFGLAVEAATVNTIWSNRVVGVRAYVNF